MNEIVILTPTYNRRKKLPKLYKSLKGQTNQNFDWWIIDDGSNDGTSDYIETIINDNEVNINYVYQPNGGKARALNKGFQSCNYAQVFVIVDSDDYLLPTAIDTIQSYMSKYYSDNEIGALFFHYQTSDGNILKPSGKMIKEDVVLNRYEYNRKHKANDGCICYFNRVVKEFKYPEFDGETYVGPTVIQMEMSQKYKIAFSPQVIGVAEYQKNGLTRSGRKLRINNPLGMIYYSGLQQSNQTTITNRIKHSIGAQAYRFFSKRSRKSLARYGLTQYLPGWAFFPGLFLKLYWEAKFKRGSSK